MSTYKMWYRQQYASGACNLCQACVTPEMATRCTGCTLAIYCTQDHRDQDYDDHLEICDALVSLAASLGTSNVFNKAYLLGGEAYRQFRCGLVSLCSQVLGRPLEPSEQELCLFPPVCATCHRYTDLQTCTACLSISWCSLAHKPSSHHFHCANLTLFLDILRQHPRDVPIPFMSSLPNSMDEIAHNSNPVEFALLSEIASCPLTILETLKYSKHFSSRKITVHIVGPEPYFEASNLRKWEDFLFNFLPGDVALVFIGPEIVSLPKKTFSKNGHTLEYTFKNCLYHEYPNNDNPTLIAAFNPGLYRKTGYASTDSWADTISAIFALGVPVLVTSYSEKEIKADLKRIQSLVKEVQVVIPEAQNPFSSRRPLRNFVSDEVTPVVFKNAYRMVLTTNPS